MSKQQNSHSALLRSNSSQGKKEEVPSSEAPSVHHPTTEMDLTTEEVKSVDSPEICPYLERLPEFVSGSEQDAAEGFIGLLEPSNDPATSSATHYEVSTPALISPVAETLTSLEAEGGVSTAPKLTETPSVSTDVAEVNKNSALDSVSTHREKEDTTQLSLGSLLEDPANIHSEVSKLQPACVENTNLMPPVIFLSGVISFLIVLQEPGALLLIGLFLVLYQL